MMDDIVFAHIIAEDVVDDTAGAVHLGRTHVEVLDACAFVDIAVGSVGTLLEDNLKDRAFAELAVRIPLIDVGPFVAVVERVTEVVTVVQRIDIVHVEQPGLSSLILIVRSRVLLGLEPQSLAQGLPGYMGRLKVQGHPPCFRQRLSMPSSGIATKRFVFSFAIEYLPGFDGSVRLPLSDNRQRQTWIIR